jgi:hypothetical protein
MSEPEEHRIARTAEGLWVHAKNGVRNGKFFCLCPEWHRLKFVKWSGKEGVRQFESYFAHISESSGNSKPTCRGGGESQMHKDAKYTLVEKFGQYHFKVYECPSCKTSKIWEPKPNARLTLEEVSQDKSWRYDAMVFEDDKPVFALEVFHTHKTGDMKVEKTKKDGIEIAEFEAEDIIHAKKGQCLKNLLCDKTLCEACKIKASQLAAQRVEVAKCAAERLAKRNAEQHMFSTWILETTLVSELDSVQYYQWTRKVRQCVRPIPVPSEAIDFTPSDLWPILWEEYPDGIAMPASVPKKMWEAHWRRRNPKLADTMRPPAPPQFVKGYWGKLRGNSLTNKRKARSDEPDAQLPPVWPPQLSKRFWERYFEKFPEGHRAPTNEASAPWNPAGRDEETPVYALSGGGLCVNALKNKFGKIYRTSTGVDAWDNQGNWLGPG